MIAQKKGTKAVTNPAKPSKKRLGIIKQAEAAGVDVTDDMSDADIIAAIKAKSEA